MNYYEKIFFHYFYNYNYFFSNLLTGCVSEKKPEESNIENIASDFVEFLNNKEYSKAHVLFSEEMVAALPIDQLEVAWNSVLDQYGDFTGIVGMRDVEEGGYDIIYVTCNFSILGLLDIKIVFDQNKMITGLWFVPTETSHEYDPPEYVDLMSFIEVNVSVGKGEWILPGTMTIPEENGLFPAIILVHGSGPNDRDESIGPNKPFKDIAWGLATKGVAVLRYEKRTKEYPDKSAAIVNLTVQEEIIDDVLAAVHLLNTSEYIDSDRIFVLGHSLGGMVGPRIAEQDERIAGLVILAGNTRGLEDLFLEQATYLANHDDVIDDNEKEQLVLIENQVEKVKTLNISEDELVLGVPESYWEDLANYYPVETVKNLKIPMLILQGERDYQVTVDGDFSMWNESLHENENLTLKTYETLNHIFISGSGPPNNSEYLVEGHVSEDVIDDIAMWINNLFKEY